MLLEKTCPKTLTGTEMQSPDMLRGGDSWHMKHCIIYAHTTRSMPLSLSICLKMPTLPRVWVENKSWHLSQTWMCRQAEMQSNSRPLKANTSLSLMVPRACRSWCQRCRHWTEKASSLGEHVIRILSESTTQYSSTAYIYANGKPAHWLGSLKCEMYVRAWTERVRRNVNGQLKKIFLFVCFCLCTYSCC